MLRLGKYDSCTEALKRLHWLPICKRVEYKIITIVHKCLFGTAPEYLKCLLKEKNTSYRLRNSDIVNLNIPNCNLVRTERAFSISGPTLWNSLPNDLKKCTDFYPFKRKLKTHLFKQYFDNI